MLFLKPLFSSYRAPLNRYPASTLTENAGTTASVSSLRPLLEHLLDGFLHQLLILVAVVAQRILGNPSPYQRLGLSVIEVDNQSSFHVLLWSDATHSAANPAHAHCGPGGFLFHAAVRS